jgi:hypothetical protein
MKKFMAISFCLSILSSPLLAQYYYNSNSPLEQRFEQQSFFFSPTYVTPYGVEEFASALPGVLDQPLTNLQINPASLASMDGATFIYTDYRTNKDLAQTTYAYPVYAMNTSDIIPYPYYFNQTQKLSVEPAFSSAVIGSPLPETMPGLTLGMSYELISQSEGYYPIATASSDVVYRTGALNSSSSSQGVDYVRNKGHFISLFSSYQLSEQLSVGARIGRSLFQRDGDYGPLTNSSSVNYNASSNSSNNMRGQNYNLWDISVGTQYSLTERFLVGATAGYSTGDITQTEQYQYSSSYSNSGSTSYSSTSESATNNDRHWKHAGNGYMLGVNSKIILKPSVTFTAVYTYTNRQQDLTLSANDFNSGSSQYETNGGVNANGNSGSATSRGTGKNSFWQHRFATAISFRSPKNFTVSFGIVYSDQSSGLNTQEYLETEAENHNTYPLDPASSSQTIEHKNLVWNSTGAQSSVQLPFIVSLPMKDFMSLDFGFNYKFLTTEEREHTLVHYLLQQQYLNGVLQSNVSDAYQESNVPQSTQMTNTMSVLVGLRFRPLDEVDVHMTAIPYTVNNQLNLQWLAGISILP